MQPRKTISYDIAGNITSKTGVGSGDYVYVPQGETAKLPHAVQSIPGIGSFNYDANGNLLSGAGRSITWNSYDMPIRISKGSTYSDFVYGSEHQRTRQDRSDGSKIIYAGNQEVEINASGSTVKTYWPAGLGLEIDKADGTTNLNWIHKDHLGSPVAISDSTGKLIEQLAYDAWGKRRSIDGSSSSDDLEGKVDNKGFTGHEMLDQLDLVHMNGRVYDPLIARFISADPHITDPLNGQNYNRYSYVLNDPLGRTDPTGLDDCINRPNSGCQRNGRDSYNDANGSSNTASGYRSGAEQFARAMQPIRNYYSQIKDRLKSKAKQLLDHDIKVKAGVAAYVKLGGEVEAEAAINLYNMSFDLKSFEFGYGFGWGGKVAVEGGAAVVLKEMARGDEQKDGTIAIGSKFGAEIQVGPLKFAGEARTAMSSQIGGSKPEGIASLKGEVQLTKGVGVSALARLNVCNFKYQK